MFVRNRTQPLESLSDRISPSAIRSAWSITRRSRSKLVMSRQRHRQHAAAKSLTFRLLLLLPRSLSIDRGSGRASHCDSSIGRPFALSMTDLPLGASPHSPPHPANGPLRLSDEKFIQ